MNKERQNLIIEDYGTEFTFEKSKSNINISFNRVTFINARFLIKGKDGKEFPFDYQPTETTAGHDLLRTKDSICLKSKDFFYFHVDHLSGYEFNKTL